MYGPLDRGMAMYCNFAGESFTERNFVADYSIETELHSKNHFLSHCLGNLGVTYAVHL